MPQKQSQRRRRRKNNTSVKLFCIALLAISIVIITSSSKLLSAQSLIEYVFAPAENEITQQEPPQDNTIIVAIDAGHGGNDGGAEELIVETQMTELTVKYLQALLTSDENFTPLLTRAYGEGASVAERCEAAQNASAQLFISVHGNTDPTRTATGFEAFPAPPGRTFHEQSLKFAQLIATRMGDAGQRLRGERGVRYKYYEELSNGKTKEILVEESNVEYNEAKSFAVVEKAGCPSVLVEQCFLTSQSDVNSWASDEGCQRAARIYYEAICEYFETQPIE